MENIEQVLSIKTGHQNEFDHGAYSKIRCGMIIYVHGRFHSYRPSGPLRTRIGVRTSQSPAISVYLKSFFSPLYTCVLVSRHRCHKESPHAVVPAQNSLALTLETHQSLF